ncbi:MAG: FapA family protein [Lachnospiraceae bacterium]|nr:FapA family protein [Lachnospiraceae bacterium]
MAGRFSEKCKVTVSEDSMSAKLFIEPPEDGIAYSVDELSGFLKNKGVYGGVIYSALEYMTQNNVYYDDYEVAKGTYPEEGSDGYYELFFDYNVEKKPAIRSDGSVDYQSMSEIQCVSIGEKVAHYHKAVPGKVGTDVRGRALKPKPSKELPALKGSGFKYNDDTGDYTASTEGKVEYDGKSLKITNVYEHKGDVDLVTGKIDFRGDVVIKGNVLSGVVIRTSKSIIVEGSVEAATLIAGGDIILKKGMQGGQKARISCGGDVYANFMEFTRVDVKGKVEANIIMNCQINAGNDVIVSGRRGAIVGGSTYAVGNISSMFLGNAAGHKTIAAVGVSRELQDRDRVLKTKVTGIKTSIERTRKELEKVSNPHLSQEKKEVREAKTAQLERRLKRDEKLVSNIEDELEKIEYTMSVGKRAKITIAGSVFAGVQIIVDEMTMAIDSEQKAVEFFRDRKEEKIAVVHSS